MKTTVDGIQEPNYLAVSLESVTSTRRVIVLRPSVEEMSVDGGNSLRTTLSEL